VTIVNTPPGYSPWRTLVDHVKEDIAAPLDCLICLAAIDQIGEVSLIKVSLIEVSLIEVSLIEVSLIICISILRLQLLIGLRDTPNSFDPFGMKSHF